MLLLDEVSMVDEKTWNTIVEILSIIDHSRRPNDSNTADALGRIHIILYVLKALGTT